MDSTPANGSAAPRERWWQAFLYAVLVLTTVILAGVVGRYGHAYAGGSDESGYLHNARLLREGRLRDEVRPVGDLPLAELEPTVYQSLGFSVAPDRSSQTPTYPFGMPLGLAVLEIVVGEAPAVWLVLVLIAMAVPWVIYRLGRDLGLEPEWAVTAAVAGASSPLVIFMGLRPMSDLLSLVVTALCLIVALRAHRSIGWALLLGPLGVWAVLIRVPNGLIAIPVLMLLARRWREQRWLALVAGTVPAVVLLAKFNQALYGGPWQSGYQGLEQLFSWDFLRPALGHFARWLGVAGSPLLAAGALGFAICGVAGWLPGRSSAALLTLWAGLFLLFYGTYDYTTEAWWYLRFVLPMFPAMLIAGAFFGQGVMLNLGLAWQTRWRHRAIVALVFVISLAANLRNAGQLVAFSQPERSDYLFIVDWLRTQAGPDDVWVCMQVSGSVYYYLPNAWVRYDQLTPEDWSKVVTAVQRTGGELYAPLFRYEYEDPSVWTDKIPGEWEILAEFANSRIYHLVGGP